MSKELAPTLNDKKLLFSKEDLRKLFIPLIVEQFLNICVGLADSIMVAKVGEHAVSGVSLVDNIMILVFSIVSAMSVGGAVIASQYLGRHDRENADKAMNQTTRFMMFFGIGMMVLVYVLRIAILDHLFGKIEPDVREAANTYFMIVVAGIPFMALYNSGAALYRTLGNTKITMYVMLTANIANVIGNAVMVFVLHMGVAGIAIPTLCSRMGATVAILILARSKKNKIRITNFWAGRFDLHMLKRILRIGLPNGIENGFFQAGRLVVLSLVSMFGTASIAANAVGGMLTMFLILPGMSISTGTPIVISRCVGAGDYEQAKYYKKRIFRLVRIGFLISSGIILAAMPLLMRVYGLSDEATHLAWTIIIIHVISMNLLWVPSWIYPVIFRAAGDANYPMVISIISMLGARIASAYLLALVFHLGMLGTWYAMYIDWAVRAVFFMYRYRKGTWMNYDALR